MKSPFVGRGERPGAERGSGPPVVPGSESAAAPVKGVGQTSKNGQIAGEPSLQAGAQALRQRFGAFVLDRESGRLTGPAGEVRLRRQAFRLLEVLVERAPRILTQEELLDRVWGVEHLSPASVKQAISEVRQALGDDPARPQIIETVHRRGYRFIAPLEPAGSLPAAEVPGAPPVPGAVVCGPAPAAREAAAPWRRRPLRPAAGALLALGALAAALWLANVAPASPPRSPLPAAIVAARPGAPGTVASRPAIAVLAFQNLSPEPDTAWISSALSEILAFELSASGRLRVVPGDNVARMRRELSPLADAPSAAGLQRIGRNLGTGLVVEGSYLQTGRDRLRLQVLVRDVRSGETVAWARETGAPKDLNELATAAARGILGSLSPDGPPSEAVALASSTESLRLYSEALDRLRIGDGPAALRLLAGAVKIDPRNPYAFDALAAACAQLGYSARAQEASRQALALAAQAPAATRLAIAGRDHELHGAWDRAAASYAALWQLHPDDLEVGLRLAVVQRKGGRTAESLATVATLSRLTAPAGDDPRIDLAESDGAWQLGDFVRARDAAAKAIAKAELRSAPLLAAAGRLARGYAAKRLGDNAAAFADFRAAHDLAARTGDRGAAAGALLAEAYVLQSDGRTAAARKDYETAIPVFRQAGDRSREAKALNNFASVLNEEGDVAGIAAVLERSLAIKREIGDLQGTALTLVNLGNVLEERGDLRRARSHFEEAIGISRRLEDAHGTALALRGLARLHAAQGRFSDGRSALADALGLSRQAGDAEGIAQAALALGDLERRAGRLDSARAAYRDAVRQFSRIAETSNAATAILSLAAIDGDAHRPEAARSGYAQALQLALALKSPLLEAQSRYGLGQTAASRGDAPSARAEYERAVVLFDQLAAKDEAVKARKALAALPRL